MNGDQLSIFSLDNTVAGGMWEGVMFGLSAMAVVKWLVVGGLIMYCGFSLVVVKQAMIMAGTFEDKANGVVKLAVWMHFLLTVGLTIVAGMIL